MFDVITDGGEAGPQSCPDEPAPSHAGRTIATLPDSGNFLDVTSNSVFGVICPRWRKGAPLILPHCDTEAMNFYRAEIAAEVTLGKHPLLFLLDQAGWHLSSGLAILENIASLLLRSKYPRSTLSRTSGSSCATIVTFKSCHDIVDLSHYAWNHLVDMPCHTVFIGFRERDHRF